MSNNLIEINAPNKAMIYIKNLYYVDCRYCKGDLGHMFSVHTPYTLPIVVVCSRSGGTGVAGVAFATPIFW